MTATATICRRCAVKPATVQDLCGECWGPAWIEKEVDRHVAEVTKGLHDSECEWSTKSRLCHCKKRRRIASGLVEPPELFHRTPQCGNCWQDTYWDDGFRCDPCSTLWSSDASDGESGEFTDDYGDLGRVSF